jgi:hypothetical protein
VPNVLTNACLIDCGHGGKVQKEAQTKLAVDGQGVLIKSDVETKSIRDCQTKPQDKPPQKPCTTCLTVQKEVASKLTIGGAGVLLAGLSGTTDGVPPPAKPVKLEATNFQTKLTAS